MADIESALERLEAALARAESAINADRPGTDASQAELDRVKAERDGLAEEVALLRGAAQEDERLRAEAAEAVKSALSDLRGLVREGSHANA